MAFDYVIDTLDFTFKDKPKAGEFSFSRSAGTPAGKSVKRSENGLKRRFCFQDSFQLV